MISLLVFGTTADDYRCPTKIGKLLYVAIAVSYRFLFATLYSHTVCVCMSIVCMYVCVCVIQCHLRDVNIIKHALHNLCHICRELYSSSHL